MSNFGEESSRKEIVWEDNIRWEDSVKLYLREIGYLGVEWIHLAWTREVIIVLYVKFIIMKCYCMSLLHSVVSDVNCIIWLWCWWWWWWPSIQKCLLAVALM